MLILPCATSCENVVNERAIVKQFIRPRAGSVAFPTFTFLNFGAESQDKFPSQVSGGCDYELGGIARLLALQFHAPSRITANRGQ